MDIAGWLILGVVVAAAFAMAGLGPGMLRDHRRRQARGAGASLSGIGGGFDSVWRPSAAEAHADWEAQVEVPAPAPSPEDGDRIADGRIVLKAGSPTDDRL